MKALDRLSIGAKLLLAPMTVLMLLLVLAASSYYGLSRQQDALSNIFQVRFRNFTLASASASKAQETYAATYQILSSAAANFPANRLEAMSKDLAAGLALIGQRLAEIGKDGEVTEAEKDLLGKVTKQLLAYRKATTDVVEVSLADYSMGATMITVAQKEFEGLNKLMDSLLALEQDLSNAAYEEAKATSSLVVKLLVGSLLLSIVLGLAVSLVVRARIVDTIEQIRKASIELKGGDLTRRVMIDGDDEIAHTARAFNDLIESFQQAVRKVLSESGEVANASQQLSLSSQSVTHGSARQADAASAVAATMEQMAVSVSSIAQNAQDVKDTSRQSLENTQAGGAALERVLREIVSVRAAFVAITASVGEFVSNTQSITNMTKQVQDLADQTNLLALNAAIEAARAGEQGRGFAVVADEVRKLAERSSTAAKDIDGVTRALEQQAVVVEQSLDAGTNSLGSSESHLHELEAVIGAARDSVSTASRGVDEIASAVREQSLASGDVARNIDEIVRMVEGNNEAIHSVSSATQQLATHASNLQAAVATFRV